MKLTIVILAIALSGCASISNLTGMELTNRVTCTVAKDKAFLVSGLGISLSVDEKDATAICEK